MRISNNYNYNYNAPKFGSLKVKYSAEDNLKTLPKPVLKKLYRFGEHLRDTVYVDMVVEKDLTPVIKGKFQKGGIFPPFEFFKPDSKNLRIKAKGQGEIPYGKIDGDNVELNIEMKNYKRSAEFYERLMSAKGDFEKTGLLTKLIDYKIDEPNIIAAKNAEDALSKRKVLDNIMGDFGTFDN